MTAAQAVGAGVMVARSSDLVAALGRNLGPLATRGVGASSGLLADLPDLNGLLRTGEDWPAVAITRGEFGIADTGSVVVADRHHADRLLALLCRRHIVLLPPVIVPALADAVPRLRRWIETRERPSVSFVAGPSRTSDIERVLTIGVHGPAELVVVLVDDWEGTDA